MDIFKFPIIDSPGERASFFIRIYLNFQRNDDRPGRLGDLKSGRLDNYGFSYEVTYHAMPLLPGQELAWQLCKMKKLVVKFWPTSWSLPSLPVID